MATKQGYALPVFRFRVDFYKSTENAGQRGDRQPLCSGMFSECSGLEATMEAKAIKVGGQNYGAVQRAGRVNFSTVILRRGVTTTTHLWKWFELLGTGGYAYRLDAEVVMLDIDSDTEGAGVMTWKLRKALPTKFKAAELNAKATDVGVEELHFVHEGMSLQSAGG